MPKMQHKMKQNSILTAYKNNLLHVYTWEFEKL